MYRYPNPLEDFPCWHWSKENCLHMEMADTWHGVARHSHHTKESLMDYPSTKYRPYRTFLAIRSKAIIFSHLKFLYSLVHFHFLWLDRMANNIWNWFFYWYLIQHTLHFVVGPLGQTLSYMNCGGGNTELPPHANWISFHYSQLLQQIFLIKLHQTTNFRIIEWPWIKSWIVGNQLFAISDPWQKLGNRGLNVVV